MKDQVTINELCDILGLAAHFDPGDAAQGRSQSEDRQSSSESVITWSEEGDMIEIGLSEWRSGEGSQPIVSLTFYRHPDDDNADDPRFILERRNTVLPSDIYEDSTASEILEALRPYLSSMSAIA